ncbi:ead/Ea22-like family protein [Klebsiella pneumoniae]|uniref:ead/Ea22-like family protein n=1 Tax=Klebsiella pneumoniae TaxID=573 RepID=UPI003D7689DA
MTDITELAHRLKAAADREMICRDVAETSEIWERTVTPENILALVEALENSESRLHEVAVACATAEQALEKAQQQTTESENRVRKQNRHICELFDDNTALRQRIAELEREQEHLRPVGVMSEQAFHRLENRECRFIALWPRPGIFLPRKHPEDGVIVYARTAAAAGIKVEAE